MVSRVDFELMMPFSEVRVLDINSEYLGVTPEYMMEEAGKGVAQLVRELAGEGSSIGMICGTGNNAGDAFVAARYLSDIMEVTVVLARPSERIRTELALKNYERVRDLSVEPDEVDFSTFDLLVDALYGTGMKGEVNEPYRTLITRINEFEKTVLSIDVPSGLEADIKVIPDYTITFHELKEGMTEDDCGKIVVHDIGIPPEAKEFVGPGEFIYYPLPEEESYRGDNGKVLIVSGGFFPGATTLAGLSSYRIGVDLVHIAAPLLAYGPIAGHSPNFIVHRLSSPELAMEDVPIVKELIEKVDSVLLGTGLCESESSQRVILRILEDCETPMVVNADNLETIGKDLSILEDKTGVLTVHHPGFKAITGRLPGGDVDFDKSSVKDFAKEIDLTVILKGRVDIISDGKRVRRNRTGNPSMSVGGTGDTLAGIMVGLLAKGVEPFDAARIASFTNGYAGDMAFESHGFGMMASDLVEKIPDVLKICLEKVL
ncbi:MAG: NAD(P)H-hydrate dehydratase [Methanomassiliicoccales archaeon]|nr:NAD(P)H-hydrate dehydratase [Methanomassiliicoccales archaeon]